MNYWAVYTKGNQEMIKKTPETPETPEIGDAIGVSDLIDFLLDLDDSAFASGAHTVFGALIKTVKLQMVDNGHFKYWHGTLYEMGHIRKWGKIGTKGKSKEFPADTKWEASDAFDSIVNKRINNGYKYASEKEAENHIRE